MRAWSHVSCFQLRQPCRLLCGFHHHRPPITGRLPYRDGLRTPPRGGRAHLFLYQCSTGGRCVATGAVPGPPGRIRYILVRAWCSGRSQGRAVGSLNVHFLLHFSVPLKGLELFELGPRAPTTPYGPASRVPTALRPVSLTTPYGPASRIPMAVRPVSQ